MGTEKKPLGFIEMPIRIAVIGSTGSIGQQTLDVIASQTDKFKVFALAAGENLELLNRQIQQFQPSLVGIAKHVSHDKINHANPLMGIEALSEIVSHPNVDLVVMATPGRVGLLPTLLAIRNGKCVALSNKEVLVMAGEIVMSEAEKYGVEIRPVDSEHSAIWQCIQGERKEDIKNIWLTASGGPFRAYSKERLQAATSIDALRHPNWKMGRKVTIDSATLMNKGFEIIEAHWLFGIPYEKIQVLIHRESIIHSMVEFVDGSIKAQVASPDMRLPIQYALNYPERVSNDFAPVDWLKSQTLNLEKPDLERFPCLALAFETGTAGGTYPTVLSAADEIAVDAFLQDKIGFTDIPRIINTTLENHTSIQNPSLESVLEADEWGRQKALSLLSVHQ